MSARDTIFERGLPSSVEAERLVLGSIQLDESAFILAAGNIDADDFSLEKHRRIFASMVALNERGDKIDRVTVAHELMRRGQLESVDGLSYLSSLDDGLPLEHVELFCVDPLSDRYTLNLKVPAEIPAGHHTLHVRLGSRCLPPVPLEVAV